MVLAAPIIAVLQIILSRIEITKPLADWKAGRMNG